MRIKNQINLLRLVLTKQPSGSMEPFILCSLSSIKSILVSLRPTKQIIEAINAIDDIFSKCGFTYSTEDSSVTLMSDARKLVEGVLNTLRTTIEIDG